MLKHKSALLGVAVWLKTGFDVCGVTNSVTAKDLRPDITFAVPSRSTTGSEKASGDGLLAPGVSFPTRFYANHVSAYGSPLVVVPVVQSGLLPELVSYGALKSSIDNSSELKDFPSIALVAGHREVRASISDVPADSISGRATMPDFVVEGPDVQESATEAANAGFPEFDALQEQEPLLHAVVCQDAVVPQIPSDFFPKTLAASPVDDSGAPSDKAILDSLFTCLSGVELKNAVLRNDQLPAANNEAREYLSKAGTQHHWSSGSWISFRPSRDTFPMHHNPLYFEDPNLERCGIACGYLTEVTTIAHFAGRIPALPYMMTVEPPCSLVRAKPDCPACSSFGPDAYFPHPDEIDLGGVAVQAAITVGMIFLIP